MNMYMYVESTHMYLYNYGFCSGSQIIDLMILVVDIIKGIQTQTAEVSPL